MSHTIVLGGGICGLAAGSRLAAGGERVTVLEAQEFVGGLAATLRGATGAGFDFGPHAYHARNERVLALFKELAADGFPARAKNVRIKFRGRFFKYPLEALDMARSMSPVIALRAFMDYFAEILRKRIAPRRLTSAEDWVVGAMGRTLYAMFFGPYTEKVWGVHPSRLAASFAQHRIPHISLMKVVLSSLRKGYAKRTGTEHRYAPLVIELFYPPKGAGLISDRLAERIRAAGGAVHTGTLVTGIDLDEGRVSGVRFRRVISTADPARGQLGMLANGREGVSAVNGLPWSQLGPEERIAGDQIVNTLPLPVLFELLGDASRPEARTAAQALRFRPISILGLRVRRSRCLPAQSIYFQDKTFTRLSETRNYGGTEICGPDETVLLCDITCDLNGPIWNATADELARIIGPELAAEGFLAIDEIAEAVVLRSTMGYPVYLVGYEAAIDTLMHELGRFEDIVTGGRQGLYKYVDMDIASEMGLAMADHLLSGSTKAAAIGAVPYEDRVFA